MRLHRQGSRLPSCPYRPDAGPGLPVESRYRTERLPNRADVARQLGFTCARITQLLDLTPLVPGIQMQLLNLEIIDGREPLTERGIREVVVQPCGEERR